MSNNTAYLTIQERIELFKNCMAFSPSDAASKVTSIAEAAMSDFMDDSEEYENDGESKLDDINATYSEHCSALKSSIAKELRRRNKSPYESRFGNIYSDYIYSAALSLASLPDRFDRDYDNMKPQIYYDFRMTLGDYLDALIDISYDRINRRTNACRTTKYRKLKKELSEIIDLSEPLCKAIGILLDRYSQLFAALDRLSYIIDCKRSFDNEIENELLSEELYEDCVADDGDSWTDDEECFYEPPSNDTEDHKQEYAVQTECCEEDIEPDDNDYEDDGWEEYNPFNDTEYTMLCEERMLLESDVYAHYLSEARKTPDIYVPSPADLYAMKGYNQFLLGDGDYSPEGFRVRIEEAELPKGFCEVAEEVITAEGIASAFKGLDTVTDMLYRLLIEPFAEIGKYRFERHLASEV